MVNGRPVKTGGDLVDPIARTPIGEKVHVTYLRDRQQHETTVTVEDRTKIFPDRAEAEATQPEAAPGGSATWLREPRRRIWIANRGPYPGTRAPR